MEITNIVTKSVEKSKSKRKSKDTHEAPMVLVKVDDFKDDPGWRENPELKSLAFAVEEAITGLKPQAGANKSFNEASDHDNQGKLYFT